MRGERLLAAMSLAVLLFLSACASNTHSGAHNRSGTWLVGEFDSCSRSQDVTMTIKSIDGTSTVSGQASFLDDETAHPCTYPTAIELTAGYHTIGVVYSAGGEVTFGAFSLTAQAGRTYDISAHASGSSYWFDARPRAD